MTLRECSHLSLRQSWDFLFSVEDGTTAYEKSQLAAFLAPAWCSLSNLGHSLWAMVLNTVVFSYYLSVGMVKLGTGVYVYMCSYLFVHKCTLTRSY